MTSFSKFKQTKPRAINLGETELVKTGTLPGRDQLPLVIEPADSDVDLIAWANGHKDLIESHLLRHGALLFRGFAIDTAERFEGFASVICPELFNENGEHPRESVSGNVYTPVFFPPEQQLLWHNENSFNYRWPLKIWFCCVQPADRGGETTIVDSRAVFQRIDPAIRKRFLEKGVMYVRNYGEGLGLDWQTVFKTSDRAAVEAQCRSSFMDFEWKAGDRLRTSSVRPATIKHPRTGEDSWFNQAQHWHISCLDQVTRDSLLALFSEADLPRSCFYGDGSPIESSVMQEILGIYRELEVCFPWQKGDVMMVDNVLAAHGRNPIVGKRKILVALGEMTTFDMSHMASSVS